MVGQIKVNALISDIKRKHVMSFEIPENDGIHIVKNDGVIIAKIQVCDGKVDGRVSVLLRGYTNCQNAVDIIEYKNGAIERSRVYTVRYANIDDMCELVRETKYVNGHFSSDIHYKNGTVVEHCEKSNECKTNIIYQDGEILSLSKICSNNFVTHAKKEGGVYNIVQFDGETIMYQKRHHIDGILDELNMHMNYSLTSKFDEDENHKTILRKQIRVFNKFTCEFIDGSKERFIKFYNNETDYSEEIEFNAEVGSSKFERYYFKNGSVVLIIEPNKIKVFKGTSPKPIYSSDVVDSISFISSIGLVFKGINVNELNNLIRSYKSRVEEFRLNLKDSLVFISEIDSGKYSITINKILNG